MADDGIGTTGAFDKKLSKEKSAVETHRSDVAQRDLFFVPMDHATMDAGNLEWAYLDPRWKDSVSSSPSARDKNFCVSHDLSLPVIQTQFNRKKSLATA